MIYDIGYILSDYTIILALIIGLSLTVTFILIALAYFPPIAPIFAMFTEKLTTNTKKALAKANKHNEDIEFEKWVSVAYSRLGYRHTYTYFKQCVAQTAVAIDIGAGFMLVLSFVVLIFTRNFLFLLLLIGSAFLLIQSKKVAFDYHKSKLISDINTLNKSQIIELPIIMAEMISIVPVINRINIITFLNQYLETAGSLSSDIRMYLNQGSSLASIEKWKERIMTNAKVDVSDYIRFIELLQNAFLEGYTNTTSQTLFKLRDNIQSKVIDTSMRDALDSNKQIFDSIPTVMVLTAITLALIPYAFQFLSMSSMYT